MKQIWPAAQGAPDPRRPRPKRWPVGGDRITLTLTANAGILVQWRGHAFLVDGIHGGGDHPFSPVSAPVLERIMAGAPPFGRLDGLFFTHLHTDHFSAEYVCRLLERRPRVPLFLPGGDAGEGVDPGAHLLRACLSARAAPVQALRAPLGRLVRYPLCPGGQVSAFAAVHDGACYAQVEHFCLLFSLGGRNLLFLGDAAQDPEYFSATLPGTPVDTVVTNPLFLSRPAGRETLLALRPEKIVVDHIPFARDDGMRFREMVARSAARWRELLPPISVLWNEQEQLSI